MYVQKAAILVQQDTQVQQILNSNLSKNFAHDSLLSCFLLSASQECHIKCFIFHLFLFERVCGGVMLVSQNTPRRPAD
jgi:hypothetical protein